MNLNELIKLLNVLKYLEITLSPSKYKKNICNLKHLLIQAPDPTPSLQPECLSSVTHPTGDDNSVPIPEKDVVKENSAEIGPNSNDPQNSDSDEIPEYLSDAANFISMAIQVPNFV